MILVVSTSGHILEALYGEPAPNPPNLVQQGQQEKPSILFKQIKWFYFLENRVWGMEES